VECTLSKEIKDKTEILNRVLFFNRSNPVWRPYKPHVTFDTDTQALEYISRYPVINLTNVSLINSKSKKTLFNIDWTTETHTQDVEFPNEFFLA